MDLLIQNLISPIVLAFALGMIAQWVKSDLAAVYFEDYAVIAWLGEVDVLRGKKFVGGES